MNKCEKQPIDRYAFKAVGDFLNSYSWFDSRRFHHSKTQEIQSFQHTYTRKPKISDFGLSASKRTIPDAREGILKGALKIANGIWPSPPCGFGNHWNYQTQNINDQSNMGTDK